MGVSILVNRMPVGFAILAFNPAASAADKATAEEATALVKKEVACKSIDAKSTCIEKAGDVIVGAGIYKQVSFLQRRTHFRPARVARSQADIGVHNSISVPSGQRT